MKWKWTGPSPWRHEDSVPLPYPMMPDSLPDTRIDNDKNPWLWLQTLGCTTNIR